MGSFGVRLALRQPLRSSSHGAVETARSSQSDLGAVLGEKANIKVADDKGDRQQATSARPFASPRHALASDRSGTSAIEFALVFPIFLVLLLGIFAYGT